MLITFGSAITGCFISLKLGIIIAPPFTLIYKYYNIFFLISQIWTAMLIFLFYFINKAISLLISKFFTALFKLLTLIAFTGSDKYLANFNATASTGSPLIISLYIYTPFFKVLKRVKRILE